MSNGSFDAEARYAALQERVANQGRDLGDLRSAMTSGFADVTRQLSGLSDDFSTARRPQWQALSVLLAAAAVVGALLYWPIREKTADLTEGLANLTERTTAAFERAADQAVTRQEMDWRSARGTEDRARTDLAISSLREESVTQAQWLGRNALVDTLIKDLGDRADRSLADLGRRVDEVRTDLGSTYNLRDVIADLNQRLDRIEQRVPTPYRAPASP